MSRYYSGRRRVPRRLWVLGVVLLVVIVGAIVTVRHEYFVNLQPASSSQQTQIVTIKQGSSVKEIAATLHDNHLIRAAWAFEWYIHSKELGSQLQAGTYAISPSTDVPTIAQTLTKGKVATKLVTILPGRRLYQIRADLINDGFTPDAVDTALNPTQYASLPVLAYKPTTVTSLEGLLYPDSFQKTSATDPATIIRESLVEMGEHLTPTVQTAFANHSLTVYQGITLASIVEQEVSNQNDRAQVAQVFFKRLQTGMTLGSDVTADYAKTMNSLNKTTDYDSYDTRTHAGLPPGPIATISNSSLQAVVSPANTDWLYFVSGDDGVTHFEQTLDQHQSDTTTYCHKLCGQ